MVSELFRMRFDFPDKSGRLNANTALAWKRPKKYSIRLTLWIGKTTIPGSSVQLDGRVAAFAP